MSLRPVNFTEDAARQIQDAVRDHLGRAQHSRVDVDRTALQDDGNTMGEFFPVIIAKDGGSDGTASTRASWTYTVQSLYGTALGSTVAVVKTRPLGPMHYGDEIASPAYGMAFYNSAGAVKLWDAGEVPNLTALAPFTNWQVDATSGEIQKKTRAILVPVTAAESAWTKVDDTEESDKTPCS